MSRVPQIPPTRTQIGSIVEDYREDHPAFAMIGAQRWSSNPGHYLFGTDFLHSGFVVITVKGAVMSRSLHSDRIHDRGREPDMVQVALSEAQWATFVSTLNIGDGVPCTLMVHDGEQIPGIVPTTNRREQLNDEVDARLQNAVNLIKAIGAMPGASKAIRDAAAKAAQELDKNLAFTAKSFDEHAEQTIEHAKIEVAAYVTGAIQRAGLKALGGEAPPVLELTEG